MFCAIKLPYFGPANWLSDLFTEATQANFWNAEFEFQHRISIVAVHLPFHLSVKSVGIQQKLLFELEPRR